MAPVTSIPRIPWETLRGELQRNWRAGSHVTVIGPTRSGKSHLALELSELRPYILVLATKRQDPLIEQLRAKGYTVTGSLEDLLWTHDDERGRGVPVHRKVVYWPQFPENTTQAQRLSMQAAAMRKAMDWADKTGGWTVLLDETMWMHTNLRLEKEMDALWFQGRTQGLTVIACAQRPSRVPRLAFSQADHLFLAKFADKRDIETLRDISSGIPKELIDNAIRNLDKDAHEFLWIDTVQDRLGVVVAPPR